MKRLLFAFLIVVCLPFALTCDAGLETDQVDEEVAKPQKPPHMELLGGPKSEPITIQETDDGFLLVNRPHKFDVVLDAEGLMVSGKGWTWTYVLTGFGREEAIVNVPTATPLLTERGVRGELQDVLEYDRGIFTEWYANGAEGIEQGFAIAHQPQGDGLLVIEGHVGGDLIGVEENEGTQVTFSQDGKDVLRYIGLLVTDDAGQILPAWIDYDHSSLKIVIDDTAALYPLHVDPFVKGVFEEWVARYDGPGNNWDGANAIAIDGVGNVYVTGESNGNGTSSDYATIKYASSGVKQWVARYNGTRNFIDEALDIAVDSSGNVYVTGYSAGSGTYPDDYATIKYDSNGVEQWVVRYNGPGNRDDFAMSIAIDGMGNVFVTGLSTGDESNYNYDFATIKYNSNGVEQWVARYNGPGNDYDGAWSIAVDGAGNVYVTGRSYGSGTGSDYATIRYDSSGVEQWVARYNGPGNGEDEAKSIAIDGAGNVYVTGDSQDDYATIKYDSSGDEQWIARYNGPGNDWDGAYSIAIDGVGNVYVTGNSVGSGTSHDYATVKYSPVSGSEQWVARYNGPGNSDDEAKSIAIDGAGNVYVTGDSQDDYATIKYDSSGDEQWVARYNGSGNSDDCAWSIAVDSSGSVYVTGDSYGSGTGSDYATIKYVQCEGCYIGGTCYANGTVHPSNPCLICDTSGSETSWSNNDGASCDDDLFCNGDDTCNGGFCSQHAGDPCDPQCQSCNETTDACDDAAGSCDDGIFCNGDDTCSGGSCSQHVGDPCDPQCQSCNEDTDVCDNVAGSCDDGVFCNGDDNCSAGACSQHVGDPCDPQCQSCNETTDACDDVAGSCDDGIFCNGDDTCSGGSCSQHAGDPCDNGLFCDGTEACDETNDICESSTGDPCDPITEECNEDTDACDPIGDDDDDDDDTTDDDDDTTDDDDDDTGDDDDDADDDDIDDDDVGDDDVDDDGGSSGAGDDDNGGCGC